MIEDLLRKVRLLADLLKTASDPELVACGHELDVAADEIEDVPREVDA